MSKNFESFKLFYIESLHCSSPEGIYKFSHAFKGCINTVLKKRKINSTMEIAREFRLVFNLLACFGIVHFLHDRSKPASIKYVTFLYCILRNIIAFLNLIQVPISLVMTNVAVIERVVALFYTAMTAINCNYLFYLCTYESDLHTFFRHWQSFKLSTGKSSYSIRRYVFIGVACAGTAISYHSYSTFFTHSADEIIRLHVGYVFKDDTSIFIAKLYFFVTMATLETLSMAFIPVFYMNISLAISGEFSTWREQFKENVTAISIQNDNMLIANYMKMYEKLSNTVRIADEFVSYYLGSNLMIMSFHVCFLLYVAITNWKQWAFLALFITYGLIIILILIAGSSMINSKVCLLQGNIRLNNAQIQVDKCS